MFMAEGLTQRLTPDHNIWVLARPLIEDWARDNLGVEAKMREAASEMLEASTRLPRLLARADRVLEKLEGRVEPEPQSIQARISRPRAPTAMHLLFSLATELFPGLTQGAKRLSALQVLLTLISLLLAGLLIQQFL